MVLGEIFLHRYADLEISLSRLGESDNEFRVDMRFKHPERVTDIDLLDGKSGSAKFDLDELDRLADIFAFDAYSQTLTDSLFKDIEVKQAFTRARTSAESSSAPLRVRLRISSDADILHRIRWEMLRDTRDSILLSTNENIVFSRYLSSRVMTPITLPQSKELNAFVVIANPIGLKDHNLAPINVKTELAIAEKAVRQ